MPDGEQFLSPNSNTWYSFQAPSGQFLTSIIDSSSQGSIYLGISPNVSTAQWQFGGRIFESHGYNNSELMLRPKAYGVNNEGVSYCLNLPYCAAEDSCTNIGPILVPCNTSSIIWNVGLSENPFYNSISGIEDQSIDPSFLCAKRDSNDTIVQLGYENKCRWAVSSIAQINDQNWSTFPALAINGSRTSTIPYTVQGPTFAKSFAPSGSSSSPSQTSTYALPTSNTEFLITGTEYIGSTKTSSPTSSKANAWAQEARSSVCSNLVLFAVVLYITGILL